MSALEQQFNEQYKRLSAAETQPDWLAAERASAMTQFLETGFPTRRDESWKYTSLFGLSQATFEFSDSVSSYLTKEDVQSYLLDPNCHSLVFLDGQFSVELSSLNDLPKGVHVSALKKALKEENSTARAALLSDKPDDSLSALNLALFNDGAYIHVDKNTKVDKPIQLLFITQRSNLAHNHRNLISLAEGASAQVIERYVSLCEDTYFNNVRTQIMTAEKSQLQYYKCIEEGKLGQHIADCKMQQASESQIDAFSFALSGALVRSDINQHLDAEKVQCHLHGLYVAKGKEHIDHHTKLYHAKPNCSSREIYKGIITDKARAVFNGIIEVAIDAQKTDADLQNNNLLLSKTAEVDTKPQLEIYADDVKCAHGATIGQLDENELFFLRARGISEPEARQLLLHAFANEIAARIEDATIRQAIQKQIDIALADIK